MCRGMQAEVHDFCVGTYCLYCINEDPIQVFLSTEEPTHEKLQLEVKNWMGAAKLWALDKSV